MNLSYWTLSRERIMDLMDLSYWTRSKEDNEPFLLDSIQRGKWIFLTGLDPKRIMDLSYWTGPREDNGPFLLD